MTYIDIYPVATRTMTTQELYTEATRLERVLEWNDGKPSGDANDLARYSFVCRELTDRQRAW